MVKTTKAKKGSVENINAKLALVIKSGKVTMGYKSVLKTLRQGRCTPRRAPPRTAAALRSSVRAAWCGAKRRGADAAVRLRPAATRAQPSS